VDRERADVTEHDKDRYADEPPRREAPAVHCGPE
jgi:hypothetical protein